MKDTFIFGIVIVTKSQAATRGDLSAPLPRFLAFSFQSWTSDIASPGLCSLNFPHIPNLLAQQILGPSKSLALANPR